jgi:hypothetical protein
MASLAVPDKIPAPLKGDPARQAPHLHRGIEYQDWRSVEAWVNLREGEALYLEGAEDFDVVRDESADAVQVRDTAANISLRSDAIVESILNYWNLQQAHVEKTINFRYLTRSGAAEEDNSPFGKGIKGLELWTKCAADKDEAVADRVRSFLLDDPIVRLKLETMSSDEKKEGSQALIEFLESASPASLLEKLIVPVRWDLRSDDREVVREAVVIRVNAHGRKFGMRPSECTPAIDRLFQVVVATAGQEGTRLLTWSDFLREFDDATQRIVTGPEKAQQKATADLILESLAGSTDSRGLLLEAAALVHAGVPEFGGPVVRREELVGELSAQIREEGVLILHGSSGMGKSKTAQLVATNIGGDWAWADFQGVPPNQLLFLIRMLASSLGDESARNVALDNLNYSASDLQAIDVQVAAIVRLTRHRGGRVIVTTQRNLSARTMQRLHASDANVCRIPRLTEKEIDEFCQILGCPSAKIGMQVKLVWLFTSGHPQLVHAQLAVLSQRGWPDPTAKDLATSAVKIDEEKEIARQLLDQAPNGDKELLFRLSVLGGAFQRSHAIAIGQIAPPLSYPADAFSRLVGPWIETVGAGYFRLSPLLSRAATENWDAGKVRQLRSATARAILGCPDKTLREIDEVLTQGLASDDIQALASVAASLALAPISAREAISNVLFWLPMVGRKPGQRVVAGHAFVNFLLRVTQFKIAGTKDRQEATELSELIDREFLEDREKAVPGFDSTKQCLLWLTTALFEYEAIVPPAKLVAYWRETLELIPRDTEFSALMRKHRRDTKTIPHLEGVDFPAQLLMMATARNFTPEDLVEFAGTINGLDEKYRRIALTALKSLAFPLRLAIDRAWTNEVPKKTSDWGKVVASLEQLQVAVSAWEIPMLDAFVRRAIAAVEDEYRGNPERATEVLAVGTTADEAQRLLKDQRAVVLYRKQDHDGALKIWREIIPDWPVQRNSPDLIPIYACQRAANSAGRLADWGAVVEFCQHGRQKARIIGEPHYSATFLADEAFGQWKNDNRLAALNMLRLALEEFESLCDNPAHPLRLHFARKMFEQIVRWCRSEVGVREDEVFDPPAGLCSRIDPSEGIEKYPVAPFDMIWYYLTDIEAGLHADRSILAAAEIRIGKSKYAAFRSLMSAAVMKELLHSRSLSRLVPAAVSMVNTMAESKAQQATGGTILEPDRYPRANYPDPTWFIVEAAICGMIVQAGTGRALDEFCPAWERDATALKRFPAAVQPLIEMKKVLTLSPHDVVAMYRGEKTTDSIRLIAAIRMAAENEFSLDQMFVGQGTLYRFVARIALKGEVAPFFGALVRKRWRERLQFPAAFLTPRLTSPLIKEACDAQRVGLSLAAGVLLAGKDAVVSSTPAELIKEWQCAATGDTGK